MGRHSLDSVPPAPAAPQQRAPVAPVTDPVLLDAVQRDLRSLRVHERSSDATPAMKRVETPFSGPVEVPVENVIGPHRPDGPFVETAAPLRAEPRAAEAAAAAAAAPSAFPAATPRPVAARAASSPRTITASGPVIVPTHRPVPVPVDASRDLHAAQDVEQQEPLGLSARTLLLSTGIGLLAATALSLLTLIPR